MNKITGSLTAENLEISDLSISSPWTNTGTENNLILTSSSEQNGTFEIGTFKITPKTSNSVGSISIPNLQFIKINKFSYSAISPFVKIKINALPETPTCKEGEELVGNVCLEKCADDEERIDGVCKKKPKTCNDGEELVGDVCLKKCADNEERIDGVCKKKPPVCAEDEEIIDEKCVKKCADDEERVDGVCLKKCKSGEKRIDGVCTKEITCKNDEEKIDGKCVKKCADDEERIDGICTKKIIAPTCKAGEILENNKCVKKTDNTVFIIIAFVSIAIFLAIMLLIFFLKKRNNKKSEDQKNNGSYLSSAPLLNSSQPGTLSTSPRPTSYAGKTPISYDNGSYLARSSVITETNQTPVANNDPKMQMQMKNPAETMQRKEELSSIGTIETELPNNSIDPRLQIHFATKSEEMQLKKDEAMPVTVSAYHIANQPVPISSSSPKEEPQKTIIQEQTPASQPVGPLANQNTSFTPEVFESEPTKPVNLSKPTTPDVFES